MTAPVRCGLADEAEMIAIEGFRHAKIGDGAVEAYDSLNLAHGRLAQRALAFIVLRI